jgi:hypothetical protein
VPLRQISGRDLLEHDFINDDPEQDGSPLLISPVSKGPQISSSSSSSSVDRDGIQKLLSEISDLSD